MARHDDIQLTTGETLSRLTVNELKPMAALLGAKLTRKQDLVDFLTNILQDEQKVRALYEELDELSQTAIQEATHDALGELNETTFRAKYGRLPYMGVKKWGDEASRKLRLFFPHSHALPVDLLRILETFVPEPPPLEVRTSDEVPAKLKRPHLDMGNYWKPDEEEVEPRVRHTVKPASQNVKAVLQLIDAGKVKVSESTGRPSETGKVFRSKDEAAVRRALRDLGYILPVGE